MKYIKPITLMMALVALITLTSCDPDDLPTDTEREIAFEKLAGAWTLGSTGSIQVDGQDISDNYPGFTLSFTDGGYLTTNGGDLFSASGTWTWPDMTASTINLDDGKVLTIVDLTETNFNFTFTFAGTRGVASGVNGIAGNYSITVTK